VNTNQMSAVVIRLFDEILELTECPWTVGNPANTIIFNCSWRQPSDRTRAVSLKSL